MTENEYGPFDDERQAHATRAAALIRAAYDDHPGVGASVPEALKVMTGACEAHGVALGMLDLSFLKGVAWGEAFYSVSLAGMITRAYQAGLAARDEGTEAEWGYRSRGSRGAEPCPSERAARYMAGMAPGRAEAEVVRRQVTPWAPVPGEGNPGD